MKKIVILLVAAALAYGFVVQRGASVPEPPSSADSGVGVLRDAYDNKRSDLQVRGRGIVVRILNDDLEGSRHQRFLLRLEGGQTLLIAHNIDLAPRLDGLQLGDAVEFYGEYEWNSKGGVIHWTHRDPRNTHVAGWLKHGGRTYQ